MRKGRAQRAADERRAAAAAARRQALRIGAAAIAALGLVGFAAQSALSTAADGRASRAPVIELAALSAAQLRAWEYETGQIGAGRADAVGEGEPVDGRADFAAALDLELRRRARDAFDAQDYDGANAFAALAETVQGGRLPPLSAAAEGELAAVAARAEILALFGEGARRTAPEAAATAQAAYECWVLALTAGAEASARAGACQAETEAAVEALAAATAPTAAPEPAAPTAVGGAAETAEADRAAEAEAEAEAPLTSVPPALGAKITPPPSPRGAEPASEAMAGAQTPAPTATPRAADVDVDSGARADRARVREATPPARVGVGDPAPGPRAMDASAPGVGPRPTGGASGVVEGGAPGLVVVYFAWDSDRLDRASRRELASAARAAQRLGRDLVIEIEGHADRSGPQSYNLGLSERRAEAVFEEIAGLLGASVDYAVRGFGEAQPAVATPDGVRERRNRRVEVKF